MDEKKSLRRKKAILILMSLLLITPKVVNCHYSPRIELVQDDEAFASYRNGNVYIGDAKFLFSIKDQVTENDILVLDERYDKEDPNMKIYNSYRIQSREERNDILEILQLYEKMYPSDWQRSIESMRTEWAVHNLFYGLNFRLKNTSHVDLNNADEERYNKELVKYFFN